MSWADVLAAGLAGADVAGARCARGVATAATFAAVAVAGAGPASAAPVMSGHYMKTTTDPGGGRTFTENWYFTPCGDGCADMSSPAAGVSGRAMLMDGQWTLDSTEDIVCRGGVTEGDAASAHYAWDANTLTGTVQVIQRQPVCDHPPQSYTLSFRLTKAL
ncbi:hypothetical protein [Mycobacterium sp. E796]|uniref:hypothetical protein n=1 Tax=Mycobacterium sp. E796 TaxID=1834151 RepID=UPI0007FDA1DD|nr:hypothetical protein [Mycobacterium sp. E796]OBI70516.1 hypothetical protein A5706_09705 [Mycobacterium sp. E796]